MNTFRRLRTSRLRYGLVLFVILSLIMSACGSPAAAPAADSGGGESAAAPAADSAAAAPAPASSGSQETPRNRTFRLMLGGREGQHVDYELWNPYAIGANHQTGPNIRHYTDLKVDKKVQLKRGIIPGTKL